MAKLRHRAPRCNYYPDLFSWAAERERRHRFSVAARIIARRHNITESRAALVCEIAGIGRGAE
jgi:hypothetical protein